MVKGAVVRLEGLPFRVSKEELLDFFADCNVAEGIEGVHLIMNREGRASGLGYVELASRDDLERATAKSETNIAKHNRYAIVVECDQEELDWQVARKKEHLDQKKRFHRVRMHGLPYRISEYDIAKWFEPEASCADVEIHLNNEGRASGEATAFFEDEDMAEKAMAKDHADMNGRYVTLTRESSGKSLSRQGFYVRMSGLPFKATEQEMVDFFQPDADCVGVRIVYNRDGRPSGDAVAEFESDEMAQKAMNRNRAHLGNRFVILTREDAGCASPNGGSQGDRAAGGGGGGSKFVIRMGGLPYRATVRDIMDWFQPVAECSHVRVLLNREGRPSGEALAEFETEEMAKKALQKNKEYMGERFVLLIPQF